MRLLLIEDDPMIGKSIRDGLRREGYSVDWVRDGWAGEQSVNAESYDMLILDLGLPRKDGLAVLSSIRASGQLMPVLIITARSEVDDRVAGLDAGADDYLVKPFSMPELSARVRALLRRSFGRADTTRYTRASLNSIHKHGRLTSKEKALRSPRESSHFSNT